MAPRNNMSPGATRLSSPRNPCNSHVTMLPYRTPRKRNIDLCFGCRTCTQAEGSVDNRAPNASITWLCAASSSENAAAVASTLCSLPATPPFPDGAPAAGAGSS